MEDLDSESTLISGRTQLNYYLSIIQSWKLTQFPSQGSANMWKATIYVYMSILDKSITNSFGKNNYIFEGRELDHHLIPYNKINSTQV